MDYINPKDPLRKGPEPSQALFDKFGKVASGFSHEAVMDAAANLILNAIRQQCPTKAQAERVFDEMFGRSKTALIDKHYDHAGKRRSVFPFNQVIDMAPFVEPDKFR